MAMTISEKILAKHAGLASVKPGDLIQAKLDVVLGNDITAPVAINEFKKLGVDKVYAPDRIALIPDHFTPNKDIKSAEQVKILREFAAKMGIQHFYDVGEMGIEHALLPEMGIVGPGDLIIGADSHTCTYGALGAFSTGVGSTDMGIAMATGEAWFKVPESIKFVIKGTKRKWVSGKDLILYIIGQIGVDGARYESMEFTGPAIKDFSIDERFTIANMAIEAGAKNGIFGVDDITIEYVKDRTLRPYEIFKSDADAKYANTIEIDLADVDMQVAFPHLPENTRSIGEAKGLKIDQVVIGSCTNGRIEDLRIAAHILKGKKVSKGLRCIIIPATQQIYKQAMNEGLFNIFIDANAAVSTPTCGPCLGGHMGVLAKGE
jgi:3-isopropylmalate/(R)-2-methylmalate dehydratase large subunit